VYIRVELSDVATAKRVSGVTERQRRYGSELGAGSYRPQSINELKAGLTLMW
jgi:hypothetical protein